MLYDANGPLWYRGWALDNEEKACQDVEEVLKKTGTRRMIMGHTPNFHVWLSLLHVASLCSRFTLQNVVARCDGKIVIIDTGISHAYGGALSSLSIHYTLTPIVDSEHPENVGKKQKWIEREVVSALYVDRQEIIADEEREVVGDFAGY